MIDERGIYVSNDLWVFSTNTLIRNFIKRREETKV
jgi:hypothetical protein